jgi:hypothetical protein
MRYEGWGMSVEWTGMGVVHFIGTVRFHGHVANGMR